MAPLLERRILVTLLVLSGFAWGFVQLADEVVEGETDAFDTALLLALRNPADPSDPLGPGWVEEFARDVTALGQARELQRQRRALPAVRLRPHLEHLCQRRPPAG
jgi:hypothetical protein